MSALQRERSVVWIRSLAPLWWTEEGDACRKLFMRRIGTLLLMLKSIAFRYTPDATH